MIALINRQYEPVYLYIFAKKQIYVRLNNENIEMSSCEKAEMLWNMSRSIPLKKILKAS